MRRWVSPMACGTLYSVGSVDAQGSIRLCTSSNVFAINLKSHCACVVHPNRGKPAAKFGMNGGSSVTASWQAAGPPDKNAVHYHGGLSGT